MVQLLKIVAAFFAGLIVTWIVMAAVGITYMNLFNIVDRDGGGHMGLIFIIGPLCGVTGGVITAVFVWWRTRQKNA